MIAVAILAAGRSLRMGIPKESLTLRGQPFIDAICQHSCAIAEHLRIITVSQQTLKNIGDNAIRAAIVVENAGPRAEEQIGSIQAAVRWSLNHLVEAVVCWPVDHPNVRPETLQELASAFVRTRAPVIVPLYGGKRGHPVLFSRTVFGELLAGPQEGAKGVVRSDPTRVLEVPVEDPGVIQDIDTPADYSRWALP